ncbi:MAG: hypothetical protein IKX30_07905 [Victivallales bacterium]|nr:hypothetical protein [Victivallales bacterium]
MDYARNAKYFQPTPSPKTIIIFAVIGAILLALMPPLGLLAIIIAIVVGIIKYGGRPSDSEIDNQRDSFMNSLKEQAIKKLGIDEEEANIAPPLFLRGYSFGRSVLGDKANMKLCDKLGKDKRWRSPECVLSAFFFTENEIHYYRKTISLVSDSYKDYTEEFFYTDIVSIKTDELERPWIDPKTGEESKTLKSRTVGFMLRNTGGETTECECSSTEEADNAVNAMRSLVRQKKNA